MTTTQFFQRTLLTLTILLAALSTAMAQHDQQVGDLLLYNYFTSDASQPWAQDTKITLTNTSPDQSATCNLYFVNGQGAQSPPRLSLTIVPRGTYTFMASEVAPGVTGYIIVAQVGSTASLIGSAAITLASGHRCTLPAISYNNTDSRNTPKLMMDMLPSPQDGEYALLVVIDVGGKGGPKSISGTIRGGVGIGSFTAPFGAKRQFTRVLDDSLGSTPLLSTLFPTSGKYGWLELAGVTTEDNQPLVLSGAVLYFSPNTGTSTGSFTGGYNLRRVVTP